MVLLFTHQFPYLKYNYKHIYAKLIIENAIKEDLRI